MEGVDLRVPTHNSNSPIRGRWIDVSALIHDGMMHWTGDPAVKVRRLLDVAKGDSHTLTEIFMSSHTGTHIDAPLHFLKNGAGIDEMPPDMTIGRARVIEIRDKESVKPEELVRHRIRPGERILLKTQNSTRIWRTGSFLEDFVYITEESAHFLVQRKVRLVGIDSLSVGSFKSGSAVHRILLEHGVWIIEGLDLSPVSGGRYELICLPLKLLQGDGAPARAILRPRV